MMDCRNFCSMLKNSMRFLVLVATLLTPFLTGCDAINPFGPESTTIEKIGADVSHGDGNKYVDKTVKVDAKIRWRRTLRGNESCFELTLFTGASNVDFTVDTCDDKYEEKETYSMKIYIRNIVKDGDYYRIEGELK